jgi:DNA mismatch repair protein MutS
MGTTGEPEARPKTDPARFAGVAFPDGSAFSADAVQPECFPNLALDQLVETLIEGRDQYRLAGFFYIPLRSVDEVHYRHEVFRDLDGTPLAPTMTRFARQMHTVGDHLRVAGRVRHRRQQHAWTLAAAQTYVDAVSRLSSDLNQVEPESRGLSGMRDYLESYVLSGEFQKVLADTEAVASALSAIRYTLRIERNSIQVGRYSAEPDYGAEIGTFFARFGQGDAGDYRISFFELPDVNPLEEKILERVALLWPEAFAALEQFSVAHRGFVDPVISSFDRDIQFYLAFLEHIDRLRGAGLPFCYPEVSHAPGEVSASDTFDITLATHEVAMQRRVVCNSFALDGPERIIVVTGPNQGGKTTFARNFGQLHHLARLGCPVPGRSARLTLADEVFTHFERGENLADMRGKLEDDLVRIKEILARATARSVVIMNEIFTSTTFKDALLLSRAVMADLSRLDCLAVLVTFQHQLSDYDDNTVSMVAGIDPEDPTVRTFQVERRAADGRVHAMVLAELYGLTFEQVLERLEE